MRATVKTSKLTHTTAGKYRKDPYRYAESDTARRRARQGASKGGTTRPRPQPSRRTQETAVSYNDSLRQYSNDASSGTQLPTYSMYTSHGPAPTVSSRAPQSNAYQLNADLSVSPMSYSAKTLSPGENPHYKGSPFRRESEDVDADKPADSRADVPQHQYDIPRPTRSSDSTPRHSRAMYVADRGFPGSRTDSKPRLTPTQNPSRLVC